MGRQELMFSSKHHILHHIPFHKIALSLIKQSTFTQKVKNLKVDDEEKEVEETLNMDHTRNLPERDTHPNCNLGCR
jgi:hypothetical protein